MYNKFVEEIKQRTAKKAQKQRTDQNTLNSLTSTVLRYEVWIEKKMRHFFSLLCIKNAFYRSQLNTSSSIGNSILLLLLSYECFATWKTWNMEIEPFGYRKQKRRRIISTNEFIAFFNSFNFSVYRLSSKITRF